MAPIYVVGIGGSAIDAIDPVTLQYELKYITFPGGNSAFIQDIAFAPDGTLYGISTSASKLYRIAPAGDHYEGTLIGALGVAALSAFAIDAAGNGYFIALDGTPGTPSAHGELYRVDLATAAVTAIGDTGERNPYDLAFYDGHLYLAGQTVGMATVDTATGAATAVAGLATFAPTGLAQSGSALYATSADGGVAVFDPQTGMFDLLASLGSAESGGAASTDIAPPSSNPQTITGLDGQTNYLVGGNGDDTVFGGNSGNVLVGLGGNDHLFGGDAADTFYGGMGANFLAGGKAADTYYVDSSSDTILENSGEGSDTVLASVTYTLPDNVELLRLTGTAPIGAFGNPAGGTIEGNTAANVIHGGSGNETIYGGGGADQLYGGAGNDHIYEDALSPSGFFAYGEDGDDQLDGGAGADTLDGGAGNDTLRGQGGNDTLYGGDGNDTLLAGAGDDHMEGNAGNDTFYIDTPGDVVIEQPGEGTDTVQVSLASGATYVMPDDVEIMFVNVAGVTGIGNALPDTIYGSYGGNVLAGAGGADEIRTQGGGANRFVYLDPTDSTPGAFDTLVNFQPGTDIIDLRAVAPNAVTFAPDGGYTMITVHTDSAVTMAIRALGTVTMADILLPVNEVVGTDNGETLKGNIGVDHIQGLGGNDVLYGYQDNDALDGGTGADTLFGGPGDDTYYVDDPGDFPVEKNAEGTDTVSSLATFTLGAYTENLTLTGTGDLNGTGNDPVHNAPNTIPDYSGNNVIVGNSGANVLNGMGGDDTLVGNDGNDILISGAGSDTLLGGAGSDGLYFGANFDASDVVDGGSGFDQIGLQGPYQSGLTLGANSLVDVEQLVFMAGNDARFGDVSGSTYSYAVTTVDANVATGEQLAVSWNALRDDENVAFNGSAETDGSFLTFAGRGADHIVGGQQSDGFFFGNGTWGPYETVDGQGGLDELGLQGNFTSAGSGAIVFGGGQLTNVEVIVCVTGGDARFGAPSGQGYSYDLTMDDSNVAAGQTLYISANRLQAAGGTLLADETLTFDGSHESDGSFVIYSGFGADHIVGGAGNDTIYGGGGADQLTGGTGDDVFAYIDAAHSSASAMDQILDFASGDSIDLSRIDAVTGGSDDPFTFVGATAFSRTAGELRAFEQTPGVWHVEGDVDGDGNADLAIEVTSDHPLSAVDLVL